MAVGGISITQGITIAQASSGNVTTSLSFAPDTVSTDAGVTLTGANIVNGVRRTGLSDGAADTTPSAASLWAAVSGATAAQTFQFTYVNTTGWPVTFTAGTGITFSGTSGGSTDVIAAGNEVVYQVTLTSAAASTITRKWALAAGS